MGKERLKFGKIPASEASIRKRQATMRHKKREKEMGMKEPGAYDNMLMAPLINVALQEESKRWRNISYKQETLEMLKRRWGDDIEAIKYFSPSTLSFCLRWAGYQTFEEYVPEERKPKTEIILGMGQSVIILLKRFLGDSVFQRCRFGMMKWG